MDDENKVVENTHEQLSLDILFKKFENCLSPKQKPFSINQPLGKNNDTSNIFSSINISYTTINPNFNKQNQDIITLDQSFLDENSVNFESDLNIERSGIDPQYLFIFALLQAINNFQNSSKNNSIEIPIKEKCSNKGLDAESELEEESKLSENNILFKETEKNNSIIFYYYDSSYIDIILLEKILIEISLKVTIKNYCLELAEEGNESTPSLLNELLQNLNYYKLVQKYRTNEYNLVNKLFVNNNLKQLIEKILTLFKIDDLKDIPQLNNFMYKKMGEIYTHDKIKTEIDFDNKNLNLIQFLRLNDCQNTNISNKINLLSFLESLNYAGSKYKMEKKIMILILN